MDFGKNMIENPATRVSTLGSLIMKGRGILLCSRYRAAAWEGTNTDNGSRRVGNLRKLAVMHGHGGALVAHAGDQMVYHYMEGMMAPMSGLRLQTAPPLGIVIYHSRMLEGPGPGEYRARLELSKAGQYQVLFHLPSQGASACFELTLEGLGDSPRASVPELVLVPQEETYFLGSSRNISVLFRIMERTGSEALRGLKDLRVLLFAPRGNWQWRAIATEVQPGLYRAQVVFPKAGSYFLLVESPSLEKNSLGLRHAVLRVEEHPGQQQASPGN